MALIQQYDLCPYGWTKQTSAGARHPYQHTEPKQDVGELYTIGCGTTLQIRGVLLVGIQYASASDLGLLVVVPLWRIGDEN